MYDHTATSAGTSAVNQNYTANGTKGGKTACQGDTDSSYWIAYNATFNDWVISTNPDIPRPSSAPQAYTHTVYGATPPLTGSSVGGAGSIPAPTLSAAASPAVSCGGRAMMGRLPWRSRPRCWLTLRSGLRSFLQFSQRTNTPDSLTDTGARNGKSSNVCRGGKGKKEHIVHRQLSIIGAHLVLAVVLCIVAVSIAVAGSASLGGSATHVDDLVTGLTPPVSNGQASEYVESETDRKERIARLKLPGAGSCLILAALCMVVVTCTAGSLEWDHGSVTYTHDVDSGTPEPPAPLAPPLPLPIEAPPEQDLEPTTPAANPSEHVIGPAPELALHHSTTGGGSIANGGLYHLTTPTFVTLMLPTGVGLSPGNGVGTSALYAEFAATWRHQGDTEFLVYPLMNFVLVGDIAASGFFAFDAKWLYSTTGQGGGDQCALELPYFSDTPGPFSAPLFHAGFPFHVSVSGTLTIEGKMRWVIAGNQQSGA